MADWRSTIPRIHLATTAGMLLLWAPLMNVEGATKMLIVTSDLGSVMRCQTVGEHAVGHMVVLSSETLFRTRDRSGRATGRASTPQPCTRGRWPSVERDLRWLDRGEDGVVQ